MTAYTARQVRRMAAHIETCDTCGDDEIRASLYDESLPPGELADYIASGHAPAWQAILTRTPATT